eukprot:9289205-Alexandrium_andersonii.AAC.1
MGSPRGLSGIFPESFRDLPGAFVESPGGLPGISPVPYRGLPRVFSWSSCELPANFPGSRISP